MFTKQGLFLYEKVTKKVIIPTGKMYKPLGPYSVAVLAEGKTLYVSGILGLDEGGQLVCGGAEAQTHKIFENLKTILASAHSSLDHILKVDVLLGDINNFQTVNQVYAEFFTKNYPVRRCFQVAYLPLGAEIEVDVIALSGNLVVSDAGPCPCNRQ